MFMLVSIASLFIIPLLIPDTINKQITQAINKNIKGEIGFSDARLSLLSHFPSLTLDLDNFTLKGSEPFKQDTLIHAARLSLGINLLSVLSDAVKVDEFYLDQASINVLTDSTGHSNYNIFQSSSTKEDTTTERGTQIKLEGIYISKSTISYQDMSIPLQIRARGLNYSGKGDLSNDVFDLKSKLHIDEFDFLYAGSTYISRKKLDARLITNINTKSLSFKFNENNLTINTLPIEFIGAFAFIKDGYDMDFRTRAKDTDLKNIFSALPQEALDKLDKTTINGYAQINASLTGKYVVSRNLMPDLAFQLKIREGSIKNPKVSEPISKLFLDFKGEVPGLQPDSVDLLVDSLYFNIGTDYLASVTHVRGMSNPYIKTNTRSDLDLGKWVSVLNMDSLDMRGRLRLSLQSEGRFIKQVKRSGIRKLDTLITHIPRFSLQANFSQGYLRYPGMPAALDRVNFDIRGSNPDGLYDNTSLSVRKIDIKALNNYINGDAEIKTAKNTPVDLRLKVLFNLADISKIYPLEGIKLGGNLKVDVQSKGHYNKKRKLFPRTTASVLMENGSIRSSHLNEALENIRIDASLNNNDGTLRGTKMNIRPIFFQMGGQPFRLAAQVNNFDNIHYRISSRGTLDIGKLYQLFAIKGYQVQGRIRTDFLLEGNQRDAMARRLHRLKNSGSMSISNLNIRTDLFPKDFLIKQGRFAFSQDEMHFKRFLAQYGQSDFQMQGSANNFINYFLGDTSSLRGQFSIRSRKINADEFMVYSTGQPAIQTSAPGGVIMIPENLNISFRANADKVIYNGLDIKNAAGSVQLSGGRLRLDSSGFTLAGARVKMDAGYKNKGTHSAVFNFKLNAENFDIARAYREVKLFRDMATSASKVKGLVSLDYQLSGRLNADMYPVLPSLKGEGVLSLRQVSLLGFKIMNAVGRETERESLTNPNLKDVNIKTKLANNILTISQTRMRIAGFRPRFEGEVALDGRLNLKGRLGLPPFGIFGIPLSITGTQSNPVVKLKRNKEGKLEETEDKAEQN